MTRRMWRPPISRNGETSIGSGEAPTTIILPSTASPPSTALIAGELVTVDRITRAPPSFFSSAATSWVVLSR